MVDQIRFCQECNEPRHVTEFTVGWKACIRCEYARRDLLENIGLVTPDQHFAENEEKIWRYAKQHGHKIERIH